MVNNYFSEIGPKLASNITGMADRNRILGVRSYDNFELGNFAIDDLSKFVKEISLYKSSGMSELST